MTGYLDVLQGYVESSDHGAPAIRERPPFGLGVLCFLTAGLSLFLAQSLTRHFVLLPGGPISLILVCLWRLAMGVMFAGFLHLLAELSGGKGSAVGLFVFLGLSDLAWALAVPAALLLRLAGYAQNWFAVWLMVTAVGFLGIALRARGLRENYGLTPGLSWLLVCVPYALTVLLSMALVSLAVFGALASLIRIFS